MRRQSRLFRDADSLRLCRMPIESEHVVRLGDRSSSCSEFSRGYAEAFFESFRKTALTRETELFRYIRKGNVGFFEHPACPIHANRPSVLLGRHAFGLLEEARELAWARTGYPADFIG